jgi:flagellar biosynthesis GTPase FlhF
MRKTIAIALLTAALAGTFLGVLPAQGIDWAFIVAFVMGGIAAIWQGRNFANMAFLMAAAILIQALINILGLMPLTKIVNGAFFVLAVWRFPDGLDLRVKKKNEGDGTSGGVGAASSATAASGNTAQSVFEEFQAFTQAQQGGDGASADEEPSKPEKKERRRGSRSSGRRGSGSSRHSSHQSSKPRERSKPPAPQEEKPRRERKSSGSRRRSSSKQPDLGKAQAALQAQQHAVQQEKQRLEDERVAADRKRKTEEARLRKEREALEREKAALKTAQPVKQAQADNRTPEEILGLNNPGYTFQDLKDARKREVARWHTSSMGNKPKDLVELAEEELKKINLAYDQLKKKFD